MVKSSQQKEKLHQLYALYDQPLYRIAYAILHQTEQAEDAVSDAFLKIIAVQASGKVSSYDKHYTVQTHPL
mgnify:CR=1 FL=1